MTYPGVFILSLNDVSDSLETVQPRVIKAWASSRQYWYGYKQIVLNSYVIARQFWRGDVEKALITEGRDPAPLIAGLDTAAGPGVFDAWLGPNEYIAEGATQEEWVRCVKVEKAFAASAKSRGKHYWALSMPVGNLMPWWVVDELKADPNVTGLSLHYYGLEAPLTSMPFAQRYIDFIKQCPLPVLIGEIGRDGWPSSGNTGWQKQNISGQQYADELRWACDKLGAWAWTVFAYGCTQDWVDKGFEVKDCVEFKDLVQTYNYGGLLPPRKEGAQPMPGFEYKGFKFYADQHPEVGKPAGNEGYDGDGNLRQLTEQGELIGLKAFSWKVLFFAGAPKPSGPII